MKLEWCRKPPGMMIHPRSSTFQGRTVQLPQSFTWKLPSTTRGVRQQIQLVSSFAELSHRYIFKQLLLAPKLSWNSPKDDIFSKCLRRLFDWMSVECHMYNLRTKQNSFAVRQTTENIYKHLYFDASQNYFVPWHQNLWFEPRQRHQRISWAWLAVVHFNKTEL